MNAIILAGGRGERMQHVSPMPKPLLPLGGEPVIFRIIDDLVRIGVRRVMTVVGQNDQGALIRNIIDRAYPREFATYAIQEQPLGPANALHAALTTMDHTWMSDALLVTCADTIFRPQQLPIDTILVAERPAGDDWGRWCYYDRDDAGRIIAYDKPTVRPPTTARVAIGTYVFSLPGRLLHSVVGNEVEISEVLRRYDLSRFLLAQVDGWLDTGTPASYDHARSVVEQENGTVIPRQMLMTARREVIK